jgi:NAD dependent epimerase/dehydratase family enzyme
VRNRELAKTIGKIVGRPAFMPAPKFLIKLAMGELGSTLLDSQRVIPENLTKAGFQFRYPDLTSAIRQIVNLDVP